MPFGSGEEGGEGALALAMLEAITDPALLIDAQGTVLAVNAPAAQAWPGLVEGRFLSMTLRSPDILSAVEAVLRGQRQARVDVIERVPVERVYQLTVSALSAMKLTPPKRQPAAMLVFRDLTEARRLEMMRVDFVANASHELRTPLASLLGFVETLQGPARNDEQARERFLDIMRTQAQRMARLIDDLLSLSRIEMSEHRRPENPVDLAAVARQMTDTLTPLAQERGVALQLHVPEKPLIVAGDHDDLLRVAENLIENAIKYGQGGGRVDVTVEQVGDGSGERAPLAVRDYGRGIAPEHLPRLTERFYRVDVADSRDKGGTGLGLAIVKHIVNRHRGRLAIESRPGEGATFRVMIPLDGRHRR